MSMGLLYAHRRHEAAERSNVGRPGGIWAGWKSARDAALKFVRLVAAVAMPKSALARGPAGLAQAKACQVLGKRAGTANLLAFNRKTLQYKMQCEQPLNSRLFLEDFFTSYAALFHTS